MKFLVKMPNEHWWSDINTCYTRLPERSFTPDAVGHRAACFVVFVAYCKTPHRIRCKRTFRRVWYVQRYTNLRASLYVVCISHRSWWHSSRFQPRGRKRSELLTRSRRYRHQWHHQRRHQWRQVLPTPTTPPRSTRPGKIRQRLSERQKKQSDRRKCCTCAAIDACLLRSGLFCFVSGGFSIWEGALLRVSEGTKSPQKLQSDLQIIQWCSPKESKTIVLTYHYKRLYDTCTCMMYHVLYHVESYQC